MSHNHAYSVTVPVLYDKWNLEVEQTNGAESRRTVYEGGCCMHIPDHIFWTGVYGFETC